MKKFLSLALAVLMLAVMLPITALAAGPSGSIDSANITHAGGNLKNAVSLELKGVTFAESVAVKLYSGDTLLTTATLQGVTPGSYGFLTCCIATETADANWALTPWTPRDNVVPDKAVLFVDGHELNTKTFTLDAEDWANLPGTVLPSSGSIVIIPDRTEDTPKTDDQKNPSTGANDFVGLAAAAAVVALLGSAVVLRKK